MHTIRVWDPVVRLFHWGTALLFFANMFVIDDDSALHNYAGYALFGLVLIRLVWGVIGTEHARFSAFWPGVSDVKRHVRSLVTGVPEQHLSHNPLGALMVFNLLATLVLICVTGIMMTTDMFWGIEWVETVHEALANYALVCVGLHVIGVLFEMHRSKVNIVKAMVTGRKEMPEARG